MRVPVRLLVIEVPPSFGFLKRDKVITHTIPKGSLISNCKYGYLIYNPSY